MCFCKTRLSKVLRAKRDIVVYKIGIEANKAIFTPYFMEDFSVYINKKTKDVLTYWYRIRRTTNLKDSQGNIVCIDDELVDPTGRKCWLLCDDELYIRYDYWLSPKGRPDIKNVQDLSKFTITKRHSTF